MNDWGALSLGGVGNVDAGMPMPGNTGPGGPVGMGLLALIRKLAMMSGPPVPGENVPPQGGQDLGIPPGADQSMAEMFGMIKPQTGPTIADKMMMMQGGQMPMDDIGPIAQQMMMGGMSPGMMPGQGGGPAMPDMGMQMQPGMEMMPQGQGGMPGMMDPGMMDPGMMMGGGGGGSPGMMDPAQEEERWRILRQLGILY